MEIKKVTWLLSALAFAGGPTFAASSDAPLPQANQQTVYTEPGSSKYQRQGKEGTPMAQMPPTGWTNLSGKVQSFDRTSQTLQLRDKVGNLFLIPMDSQVTLQRDGKAVSFAQVHKGDTVRLHMTRSQ